MTAVGMYRYSISLFVLLSGGFDYAKLFWDSLRRSRSQNWILPAPPWNRLSELLGLSTAHCDCIPARQCIGSFHSFILQARHLHLPNKTLPICEINSYQRHACNTLPRCIDCWTRCSCCGTCLHRQTYGSRDPILRVAAVQVRSLGLQWFHY